MPLPFIATIAINLLVGLAATAASSLLGSIFKKPEPKTPSPGIRTSFTVGGDAALSFIVGRYGTAGHREYVGAWGSAGDTPNAYLTELRSVSDLPSRGLVRVAVNGEWVSFGASEEANGYPAIGTFAGKLWMKFFDGSQTTADAFMVAKFGSNPEYPYLSDMIGRGLSLVRMTALYDRNIFNGPPDYFFEVDGITVTDPRGSNAQNNPIVQIRQILKGITYAGSWVWGLQGLADTRFHSTLNAQMDKCDTAIALAGGGTEPRFRAGAEISVDQAPIDVITELLEACNARIAEIGGVYKILVAEPAASVASFTDEDIVITTPQSFEPFPGLESTFNGINATYPEPAEKWSMKDAPSIIDTALEAEDDGRRLPASLKFDYVPYGVQVQRLMRAMHLEDRRWRAHTMTMPPEWWEYEVLDTVNWTSVRNGYSSKVGLITLMDDLPNALQFVGWKEQDASDYSWTAGTDQKAFTTLPLVIQRPPPQITSGFSVAPYIVIDASGNSRRPAIEVFWDSGLHDVRGVRIQVRESWGAKLVVADATVEYDIDVASPSVVISNGSLLPAATYEVRALYLPFSGRITRWSNQNESGVDGAWASVTTPNVKWGGLDLDLLNLSNGVLSQMGQIRSLIEQFKQIGTTLEAMDRENYTERQTLSRSIEVKLGDLSASFDEVIEVALGPGGAIATALESLYAAAGGNTAAINVKWTVAAAPAGYSARYVLQAAVNDGTFRAATLLLDVPTDTSQPTRIGLMAGQTVFYTGGGVPLALINDSGHFRSSNGVVDIDMIGGDFSITV